MSRYGQILVLCVLSSALVSVLATEASERESESVEVTFYQLSSSEWSSSETAFKTLVAAEAKNYCSNNSATCGLASGFQFDITEVGVQSGPTEEGQTLKISFYTTFPVVKTLSNPAVTQYVVNKAAVTTIVTNIRDSLESAVGAEITYINDEFYGIDPDEKLNKILIPIAFIILLAIIILAIALHIWDKRKEQAEKKKQRALDREKRKKMSRVTPMHTVESETKKSGSLLDSYHNASEATVTTDVAPHYEDPVPLRSSGLPPLPNPGSKGDAKEQLERKREKRRRKREKRQQKEAEEGREEPESEFSKTESLEKSLERNVVPVEDEAEVVA